MTRILVLLVALLVGGCSTLGGSGGSPGPSVGPSGTPPGSATASGSDIPGGSPPAGPLGVTALKLRLVDRFGPRWYCDPDEYPIARGDAMSAMREHWPEVVADADALAAILAHEKLPSAEAQLTDEQRLAVYTLWKALRSVPFDAIGNGRYRFDYVARPQAGAAQGTRSAGIVDAGGGITIEQQAPASEPNCPICLARGTTIDTPGGPIGVERLALGDSVWTLDRAGRRIPGVVVAVGSVPAPAGHEVVRIVLVDGRSVTASPGHPLPDGRRVGELRIGDDVDGSAVAETERTPYGGGETFDIAVSGPTGIYLAGGIALASTLR